MGELVVKNGLIVTMDDDRQIYRNGSIRVQDDHIAEIGPAAEVSAATETAETIDATGQIVMPGFVSTHNHLYSAVVRSIPYGGFQTDDFSFIAWMERFWFPMLEDRVTREQMYIGTLANCLGHIRSGITTTADTAEGSYALPGALEDVDRGAMESGIRAVLSFETTGRISE
jgi:5-methylthioadenosine/S-adenosylhomocysteine deaminase